jgi:hypothetical protein
MGRTETGFLNQCLQSCPNRTSFFNDALKYKQNLFHSAYYVFKMNFIFIFSNSMIGVGKRWKTLSIDPGKILVLSLP